MGTMDFTRFLLWDSSEARVYLLLGHAGRHQNETLTFLPSFRRGLFLQFITCVGFTGSRVFFYALKIYLLVHL